MRAKLVTALTLIAALQWLPAPLPAQSVAERLAQKAKEAADKLAKKAEDKADQAVDKAVDKLDECLFTDTECIKKAKTDGKKVTLKDEDGNAVNAKGKPLPQTKADMDAKAEADAAEKKEAASEAKPADAAPQPPPAVWTNFDFVPGSKVLFADDFSRDRVGNFPQRLQLIQGNMEIVDVGGRRFLRSTSDPASIRINLPQALPQRFTVEFDVEAMYLGVTLLALDKAMSDVNWGDACATAGWDDTPASLLCFSNVGAGITGGGLKNSHKYLQKDGVFRARVQVDGKYVKAYVDEERVVNHPSANFGRANAIQINLPASGERPALIGNIVISAGGQQLYDALLADGRVATQGIFFDTGSDMLRPESGATLKQIGDMLKEHAELKLMIEGHTDNVGTPASNLALSQKRAAAVRAYLTANFGVDGERLQSTGLGDTKPAAPNTTNEGRQQNRRVELVKM